MRYFGSPYPSRLFSFHPGIAPPTIIFFFFFERVVFAMPLPSLEGCICPALFKKRDFPWDGALFLVSVGRLTLPERRLSALPLQLTDFFPPLRPASCTGGQGEVSLSPRRAPADPLLLTRAGCFTAAGVSAFVFSDVCAPRRSKY